MIEGYIVGRYIEPDDQLPRPVFESPYGELVTKDTALKLVAMLNDTSTLKTYKVFHIQLEEVTL